MSEIELKFGLPEKMFMKASADCPASVTAQSASIALYCKQNGLNPKEHIFYLEKRPDIMERMSEIAKNAHNANIQKRKKPEVTPWKIKGFFEADFSFASELMVLPEFQLQGLVNLYKHEKLEKKEIALSEVDLREIAEILVKSNSIPTL